jgi:hypothetical protein
MNILEKLEFEHIAILILFVITTINFILLLKNNPQAGLLERIEIDNGHTVGWAFTQYGGAREIQIHPKYQYMI